MSLDQQQIERGNLIERYLAGKLSSSQEAEFEEYLFDQLVRCFVQR